MSLSDLLVNLKVVLPLMALVAWSCILLIVDLFIPKERKGWTAFLAVVGLIMTMGLFLLQGGQAKAGFNGMVIYDGFSSFLNLVVLGSGVAGIALAYDYNKRMNLQQGEYYTLLLFSIIGIMLMAQANDLIVIFLSLELLSIPLYVLAGFARPRVESEEAALKYFLIGAFSTGFEVFGIALAFGGTGTTNLSQILTAINSNIANMPLLAVGAGLILVGLAFKVAAFPFHMWTPDVYVGAPSPVTGFMSVGAKIGGFAALLRIFVSAFPSISGDITMIIWVVSALTMFFGNVVAIAQTNIKRLLAYSAIAQTGYILMALVPYGNSSVNTGTIAAGLFYLISYAIMTMGAWAVVIALEKEEGQGLLLDDYAGLGRKYPLLAATMAIFMMSFTSIPPTLGFMGKFYLFRTVITGGYLGLAIIGVFTTLLSAYYYLRVIIIMYMREGEPVARTDVWLQLTAAITAVLTIVLTLTAQPLMDVANKALMQIF